MKTDKTLVWFELLLVLWLIVVLGGVGLLLYHQNPPELCHVGMALSAFIGLGSSIWWLSRKI